MDTVFMTLRLNLFPLKTHCWSFFVAYFLKRVTWEKGD